MEMIILIVLVGLFLSAVVITMQSGMSMENRGRDGLQQIFLAESAMEEIMADRHSLSRGFTHLETRNYAGETGISGFTRDVSIEDDMIDGRPAKRITVVVRRGGGVDVTLRATVLENW